ncbi:MAG: hypothetical protein RL235_1186 [Chlamydiota bacterium]
MGMLSFVPLFSFAALYLYAHEISPANEAKQHALFLMQQTKVEEAFDRYREYLDLAHAHDYDVLQQMGLILLQKGVHSDDPQTFLMSLFGAGISGSTGALEILEKGLFFPDPQVQQLSLHFIAQFEDNRSHELLNRAMSSDYLSTRMEAAYYMSERKHPHAVGQIEGLMVRLPPAFKPYFPPFFALIGTSDATAVLKRLLEDIDPQVRIESILNIGRLGRDDFLPVLRKRLTHSHIAELEATIFAVGLLKDSASIPKLRKLANSPTDAVRIAAVLALHRLGDRTNEKETLQLAMQHNLFAIAALSEIPGFENELAQLVNSPDLQVRLNAAIALLRLRDPRCLGPLIEILVQDTRDLAVQPFASIGRTIVAFKAVPSAELRTKDPTIDLGYSMALKEQFLREAIHLPETDFVQLARHLMIRGQNALIPTLIVLLENLRTDDAVGVLEEGVKMVGAPLIRDYCHLALYRLGKTEADYINRWVMRQKDADLIRLRPMLPWKYRLDESEHALSPEETSKLLVDAFTAIANRRDQASIAFLLEAIQLGNPQNRYALIGLLLRATE